ncbi:putative sulfate exporter family transporter [Staphylococcus aureus]
MFKSREKDTAISIGIIALIGTIFSLIYTAIYAIFSMTTNVYGAWSGVIFLLNCTRCPSWWLWW